MKTENTTNTILSEAALQRAICTYCNYCKETFHDKGRCDVCSVKDGRSATNSLSLSTAEKVIDWCEDYDYYNFSDGKEVSETEEEYRARLIFIMMFDGAQSTSFFLRSAIDEEPLDEELKQRAFAIIEELETKKGR